MNIVGPSASTGNHGPRRHLSEDHRQHLRESGLTDEHIDGLAWYSLTETEHPDAARLTGRRSWPGGGASLVIPYTRPDATVSYHRVRPDRPAPDPKMPDKLVRYFQPVGTPLEPYFPTATANLLRDASVPLVLTEGEKKGEASAQLGYPVVAGAGVYGFHDSRSRKTTGRFDLHPLIVRFVDLRGRRIQVLFDYDPNESTRRKTRKAARVLARMLGEAGAAEVCLVEIPGGEKKVGIDDFLVAHGEEAVRRLLSDDHHIDLLRRPGRDEPLHFGIPLFPGMDPPTVAETTRVRRGPATRRELPPEHAAPGHIGRAIALKGHFTFLPLPAPVLAARHLSAGDKLTVAAVRRHGTTEGDYHNISERTLAKALRVGRSTVSERVRRLEDEGLLEIRRSASASKAHARNAYRVCGEHPLVLDSAHDAFVPEFLLGHVSEAAACIAAALATKAGDEGWAKISNRALGDLVGRSPSSARDGVRELVEAGFISRHRRAQGLRYVFQFLAHPAIEPRHLRKGVHIDDALVDPGEVADRAGPTESRPGATETRQGEVAPRTGATGNQTVDRGTPLRFPEEATRRGSNQSDGGGASPPSTPEGVRGGEERRPPLVPEKEPDGLARIEASWTESTKKHYSVPIKVSATERRILRSMISEHGEEAAALMVRMLVEHQPDLGERYSVLRDKPPSIAVLSFVPELHTELCVRAEHDSAEAALARHDGTNPPTDLIERRDRALAALERMGIGTSWTRADRKEAVKKKIHMRGEYRKDNSPKTGWGVWD